jgi:hypothetical protein
MVTESFAANLQSILDRIGSDVVFQPFVDVPGNTHAATKEVVSVETAYPENVRKTIRALIDWAPSLATRTRLGLGEEIAAVLTVTAGDVVRLALAITNFDRFTISGFTEPFYVVKVAPTMQSGGQFYAREIAVTRKAGGKRR